jgi:CRP/FNR family cyclic AMP-dependent transcriptional regulator
VETLGRRLIETEQRLADMPGVGSVEVAGTHEGLAQGVGAYRETVTKILNERRGQGLVELGRGRVVLLETEKLRHLCAE